MRLRNLLLLATGLALSLSAQAAVSPPRVVQQYLPQYPFEAFEAGVSGTATVEFVVGLDGKVSDIRVVKATGEDFGKSSVACISKWRFTPATKDGRPIFARLQQEFAFDHPKKKR